MHYKLSPRQIARCRCNDCSVNVIEAGDYWMLRPRIWRNTFGLGITDNLCLACIERRLGRAITIGDVITFPIVDGYPMSDSCMHGSSHPRSGGGRRRKRPSSSPARPARRARNRMRGLVAAALRAVKALGREPTFISLRAPAIVAGRTRYRNRQTCRAAESATAASFRTA